MTEKDLIEFAYKIAMRIVCFLVGHEDWRTEILHDGSAIGYGSELCFRCNQRRTMRARITKQKFGSGRKKPKR